MSAFDDLVERVARAFHTTYEQLGPSCGWQTQESARGKDFDQLSPSNRDLMLATIRRLVEQGVIDPGPDVAPPTGTEQTPAMRDLATRPGPYVSVPTMIEAMRYTAESRPDVEAWLTAAGAVWWPSPHPTDRIMLMTPQSSKPVDPGDRVVRGVVGEWYPVADEVFRIRYRDTETADV